MKDPRVLYPILFLLVAVPLIHPIGLPLNISADTRNIYNDLNALPPGKYVLVGMDLGWVSWPELSDVAKASVQFLMTKNLKIVFVNFNVDAQGTILTDIILTQIPIPADKKYGVDYVNLGFIPGGEGALAAFAKDIRSVTTVDAKSTPLDQLPIMSNVRSITDFSFVFNICQTAGMFPEIYIRQVQLPYHVPLGVATISSMAPALKPYVDAGQVVGIMNSSRGGAEMEILTGFLGPAAASMDSQSLAHVYVIFAVIMANIYFGLFAKKSGGAKQ